MLPDRVSNPGPLTYESGALPIALRGPALLLVFLITNHYKTWRAGCKMTTCFYLVPRQGVQYKQTRDNKWAPKNGLTLVHCIFYKPILVKLILRKVGHLQCQILLIQLFFKTFSCMF